MKDLFTTENLKKLIIILAVAIASYFGYDAVFTPKEDTVNTTEVINAPIDTTAVDTTL